MKLIKFNGFSNTPSECYYSIIKFKDKDTVVFIQKNLKGTSITNMIEFLASTVVNDELADKDPKDILFFEYYVKELDPLVSWQRVSLNEIKGSDGIWVLSDPSWSRVSEQDKIDLEGLI